MAARVEAAVAKRVAAALAGEGVAARLGARLREERTKLEEKVGMRRARAGWGGVGWGGVGWSGMGGGDGF
jgi:hypothetical protein